jgi:rhodanese-related sulfurtransferase
MRKLLISMSAAMILAAPLAWGAETGAVGQGNVAQQAPAQTPAVLGAPAAFEYKYKTPQLKRGTIDALLAKPESLLVIDVRRPDELTAIGGLPVYLSIQAKDLEKSLAFIPRDRIIVTVSNHAGRAGAAGDLLTSHGFNVAGAIGVQNYEAEGGVLTKITPSPPRAPKTAEIEKC